MADFNNLTAELEDQEADIFGLPPSQDDDVDADAGEEREGEAGAEAPPQLPPALAEAERLRSRRTEGDGDDDGGADGGGGFEGDENGGDNQYESAAGTQDTADADVDDYDGDGGAGSADAEFEQLKSLWAQELMCPEILPNDAETVALHLELLRGQEDTIEELREQAAGGGGGGEGAAQGDPMLAHLAAGIYKMEADRVRFLLADLTRVRLHKIESHALHNREMVDRMSEEEVSYLKKYGQLLERHFRRSVLDQLPKGEWRRLDTPEMIDRPDLDEYVFCKVLETVEIDNGVGEDKSRRNNAEEEDDYDEEQSDVQEFPAGSSLIARYATVQDFVLQGKVVLQM